MNIGKIEYLPSVPGVYLIRNTRNGKVYVGQSQIGLYQRCYGHLAKLQGGGDNRHLQADWDKCEADFVFEVLVTCEPEECSMYETHCIAQYHSYHRKFGYNIDIRTSGAGSKSQETIDKIQSDASKAARSKAMTGRVRITDGVENRSITPGQAVPDGWWEGLTIRNKRKTNPANKGLTTGYDPLTGETMQIAIDDPRYLNGEIKHIANKRWEGVITKRQETENNRLGPKMETLKGCVWINNGVVNKRIPSGPIPNGWNAGRLPRKPNRKKEAA